MPVLTSLRRGPRRAPLRAIAAGLTLAAAITGVSALPAQAAGHRVALRVLVVSSGDPATAALATELDREGIPYTTVALSAAGRPTIDAAFLEDTATGTARYQAVVLPNQAGGGLAPAETAALVAYETAYGVRQVDGYDYPGASMGLGSPTYAGALDGAGVTVTAAGLAGPFTYLKGTLAVDDVDPAVTETYGYLAQPSTTLPVGQSFTPLLTATVGSASGVLAGVFAHDGREELVLPASFNQNMQWFNTVAPGLVSWVTRGIHLGYQRNTFDVQVDDVFLGDSRWSVSGNCTPGDGCVDPTVTTTDIRMTPADVTALVAWQKSRGFGLDMVFNGGGSVAATTAGNGSDPLTTAFLADKGQFQWINHTFSHQYLGCIQVAAVVVGQAWHCATSATEQPRLDPEIAQDVSGGGYWAAASAITSQVADNLAWATTNALPNFDPTVLVTGEHSGLAALPQQPVDNPFLAPALAALGIRQTASDASREPNPRVLPGGVTSTVPRHPMNIYYNAGTYQDEVDEYNWYYTSAANGGGGICEANPATSTCITPLPAATPAQAKQSYDTYLQPLEVRNALRYVLTNDPRPFYAHQSNLAEDGILYPVLDGVLTAYRSVFDSTKAPLQQAGLAGQALALKQMSDWKAVSGTTDGYVDGTGVHVPATAVAVPVTVPAGSTTDANTTLTAYAGSLSGWVSQATTVTVPTANGGYLVAPVTVLPDAPTGALATPGSTTATVTWTAPASDGGTPITGYVVRAFAGTATTPAITVQTPAATTSPTPTTVTVAGLVNGTSYRFDVAAVNAVGTGPASTLSLAVTPRPALAPVPSAVVATAGNGSAAVTWAPPSDVSGVTGYRVRAFVGTSTAAARTVTVAAGQLSASVSGLLNGVGYTFEVASLYATAGGTTVGPASVRSAMVTPTPAAQTPSAPAIVAVVPANRSAVVSWLPPVNSAAGVPSGYRVRAYLGSTGVLVVGSVSVAGTATQATVNGLSNGLGYSFDVIAQYPTANGPASAHSVVVVPQAVPAGPPRIGTASSGTVGGAITATARWSAPAANGGSAISGYLVTASAIAADGTVSGTTTSALLAAGLRSTAMTLPTVGRYSFTVVARTSAGDSLPSAASNIVTAQ